MKNKPTIDQYLISTCLFIIDELNSSYSSFTKKELKSVADEKFNEMDISVRIGYPFRNMVHYTVGESGKKKGPKINHDLYIEPKNFKIEVKYLKNWKSSSNTYSASKTWNEYQCDFDWLLNEIDAGNKGECALIIGWFNCVSSLSQLIQLGSGSGSHPLVNESRLCYFPFLRRVKVPTYTSDLAYSYSQAYKELHVNPIGERIGEYNCMFLGNEDDCFHFAIYY